VTLKRQSREAITLCDARRRHIVENIVVLFRATRATKGRRRLFTALGVGLRQSTYVAGVAAGQKMTRSALW